MQKVKNINLSGIILAGGKSTRFGSNKAFAQLNGKEFINYSIDLLIQYTDNIIISGENNIYGSLGYKCIPDIHKSIGPIGGIHSCLKDLETEFAIVVTCDMPYVTKEIIDNLIKESCAGKATFYYKDKFVYPFPGVYSKSLTYSLQRAIDNNIYRVKDALNGFDNMVEISDIDLKYLRNINNKNFIE